MEVTISHLSAPSSAEIKLGIMKEVQQEASSLNARELVEVRNQLSSRRYPVWNVGVTLSVEHQHSLLRAMRTETRAFVIARREFMLIDVHAEVHGGLEHGVKSACRAGAEGNG
jgi:hypothetical protein